MIGNEESGALGRSDPGVGPDQGLTLEDVVRAADARSASLTGELAGYLVLAVIDQVAAAPREVAPEDVDLADNAAVTVRGTPTSGAECEIALRSLLAELLCVARPRPPALSRATQRSTGQGPLALRRELESALIPLNWAASKRGLGRLTREVVKARDLGKLGARCVVIQAVAPASLEPAPAVTEAPALERRVADAAPVAELSAAPQVAAVAVEEIPPQVSRDTAPQRAVVEARVAPTALIQPEPVEHTSAPAAPVPEVAALRSCPKAIDDKRSASDGGDVLTVLQPAVARRRERDRVAVPPMAVAVSKLSCGDVEAPLDYSGADATEIVPPTWSVSESEAERESADSSEVELVAIAEDPIHEPPPEADAVRRASGAEKLPVDAPDTEVAAVDEPSSEAATVAIAGSPRVEDRRSDVAELLAGFQVAQASSDQQLSRVLKGMAGLDLTPLPSSVEPGE